MRRRPDKPTRETAVAKGGRPVDHEKRAAIMRLHLERPDLDTHAAIAAELGVSRALVARVLPSMRKPAGLRVMVPADMVARARAWCRVPEGDPAADERAVLAYLATLPG